MKQRATLTYFLFSLILVSFTWANLSQYVYSDDGHFQWKEVDVIDEDYHEIELISQVWQGAVWKHRLYAFLPESPQTDCALLFISGRKKPLETISFCQSIMESTGSPVFLIFGVPNQPLFDNLWEDALISYTMQQYLKKKDPTWLALYPMTKAAVRAMDAAQEFSEKKYSHKISRFIVSGGSKRGWTTWLCAAMDKRVEKIVPIVYDNLNLKEQMKNQITQWGNYSPAIGDYSEKGLPQILQSPAGEKLAQYIDPYSYLDQITIPKIIVNGTNDPYWPLNALKLYYSELKGENYIVYEANNGHGVDAKRVQETVVAALLYSQEKSSFPQFICKFKTDEKNLEISFRAKEAKKIKMWRSSSLNLDFRDSKWTASEIPVVLSKIKVPLKHYNNRAIFIEAHFVKKGRPFRLCSHVEFISAP